MIEFKKRLVPDARASDEPVNVTLVVVPRFPLLSLAICIDALRVANRESLRTAFAWTVASEDGESVSSSSAIPVNPTVSIQEIAFSLVTVVLAAYEPESAYAECLLAWLKKQDRAGGFIGCVDTGALILAKAGLLSSQPASVHSEVVASVREDFGNQLFSDRAYTFEGRRLSSAGGFSTMQMMLALIERCEGKDLSDRVADVMNYPHVEDPPARQRTAAPGKPNPALSQCVELMQTHLEDPLSLRELGACLGVRNWTLRRLFRRYLNTTPLAYYHALRLKRAQQLLAYSHLSVSEIAVACGFADTASFSHAFRKHFGAAPSQRRHDISGAPEGH